MTCLPYHFGRTSGSVLLGPRPRICFAWQGLYGPETQTRLGQHKQKIVISENNFGCGVLVALSLWGLLLTTASLPDGGTLEQLLWTLLFMKTYAKQKTLCSLCGGIDPQTLQKWVKLFVEAISSLEPKVVRNNMIDSAFACHRIFMLTLPFVLAADRMGESVQERSGQ
jgi:hypothetical protein